MILQSEKSKAAVYARESKDYALAVEHQYRLCEAQAESEDFVVPPGQLFRFGDNDVTGATSDRSAFQRLIRLVESGQAPFTALFVQDRSRLGRWDDPRSHFVLEVSFQNHGIQIRYCDEEPIDWNDMTGGHFKLAIKAFIDSSQTAGTQADHRPAAEGNSKCCDRWKLSRHSRTLWARAAVEDDIHWQMGRAISIELWRSTGRHGDRTEVDSIGSCSGKTNLSRSRGWTESVLGIASDLGDGGILFRDGVPFQGSMVAQILNPAIYMGDLVWGVKRSRETPVPVSQAMAAATHPIYYKDFCPNPPISRVQWARVQRILQGERIAWSRRRAMSPDFLLRALCVCGVCGAGLHGHTRPPRKDGTRLRYYKHSRRQAPSKVVATLFEHRPPAECAHAGRYYRADQLDEVVIQAARSVVFYDNFRKLVDGAIQDRLGDSRAVELDAEAAGLEDQLEHRRQQLKRAAENAADSDAYSGVNPKAS